MHPGIGYSGGAIPLAASNLILAVRDAVRLVFDTDPASVPEEDKKHRRKSAVDE